MIQTSFLSLPSITAKKCNKCGEVKDLGEFNKDSRDRNKLWRYCKKCHYKQHKIWINNNPEKVKGYRRKWKKNNPEKFKRWENNNPEKVKGYKRKWYEKNIEFVKKSSKLWAINNPEKNKECKKKWVINNPEKVKEWKKNNPEKMKTFQRRSYKKQMSTFKGRLDATMKTATRCALRGKKMGRRWKDLVGWDENDLLLHLEKQFIGEKSWMNHNNYGNKAGYWDIDHIIPRSYFHYETEEDIEFKKCWALSNLQPMEFIANIKKGKKLIL